MIWVGTSAGGLNRLDPETGRVQRFRHDGPIPTASSHDQVRAIFQDADGRLWAGTGDGLDLFDPVRESFVHYRHDPRNARSLADGARHRAGRRTAAACCGWARGWAACTSGTR